jgi:hypothetical protein
MGKKTGNPRGRPAGYDKERARLRLREIVLRHHEALVEAQIKNALGIRYLVSRDRKTGKFTKLTEEQAKAKLGDEAFQRDNEILEIWDERPNVQAFTDLMNRTIDKPAEHVEQVISGGLEIAWKE